MRMKSADDKMRMEKCGWQNADGKCGWKNAEVKMRMTNVNDNIETRGNKFTMFSYILSCKIRPREFIERNIFYAGYAKSEIKKEHEKTLIKQQWSLDFGCLLLSKFPLPKTVKISETLLRSWSAARCTVVDKFVEHTERSQQKTVYNTCVKVSLSQGDGLRAMESCDSDDSLGTESVFFWKTWLNGFRWAG